MTSRGKVCSQAHKAVVLISALALLPFFQMRANTAATVKPKQNNPKIETDTETHESTTLATTFHTTPEPQVICSSDGMLESGGQRTHAWGGNSRY
jgi:hypothetical protein